MTSYIGEKLRKLRENNNMSLEDVSKYCGVSRQSVHRYEQNIKSPSSSTILELSKIFNVHPSHFFNSAASNVEIKNIKFRDKSLTSHLNKEITDIQNTCKDYLLNFLELQAILKEQITFENPLRGIEITNIKDVEKAAKKIRSKWKIGNAPIQDVTELIEDNGIIILEIHSDENFTGLTGEANDTIPFIVVNKNCKELTRKRFTLLHELGHVVLEFSESLEENTIEKLCNHFAGAVLLIDDNIINEIGKNRTTISLRELKEIKEKYGISIQSIIIRAGSIGLISFDTSKKWKETYNQWYSNSDDNSDFGKFQSMEQPKKMEKLILRCIIENRITWGKAAKLMNTKIDILKRQLDELEFKIA